MSSEISTPRLTALLTLGIVVMGSNSLVLSPILTDVARDLETTPVVIARVISVYGAATALSSALFGGVIDRFGARRVLLVGAAAMVLALIGCAASIGWISLALSQAVVGGAVGVMLPAVYATATASAPAGEGARVLGRVVAGWGISMVVGVPVSAFITEYAGWRATFGVLAAVAAAAMIGFSRLPSLARGEQAAAAVSPAAALGIPGVVPLLAICCAYMTAFYGLYAFLGDHLRVTLDLNAGPAGLVVLGYGAGFGLASLAGASVDRIGPRRLFPAVLLAIAAVYLALIPATAALGSAIAMAVIWGFVNHIGVNLIILFLS
ncbi:MAG: MFS transporter, partial [Minwuiales bacterium]|nr:MFS transporter [Minwuiales bacterium]